MALTINEAITATTLAKAWSPAETPDWSWLRPRQGLGRRARHDRRTGRHPAQRQADPDRHRGHRTQAGRPEAGQ